MDDPLIADLDDAEDGKIPSPSGRMEFVVHGAPASVQSKGEVRDSYLKSIRSQFSKFQFILTGQIILNVTWFLSAKSRYETDSDADLDNCLKPILDAFTGPDGLFIDDCQIKGLYICWRHIESKDERLLFEFEFEADHYCAKKSLAFLRLKKNLCTPVDIDWPHTLRTEWVRMLEQNSSMKIELQNAGISYLALARMLGGGQPFHVSRVQQFRIFSTIEFTQELLAS